MPKLYKVFKAKLKSNNGNIQWKLNEWQQHKEKLEMCVSGYHASERIINAMQYTNAEIIAEVEVKGKHIKKRDKQVWEYMRIIKTYEWTKEDSNRLAIYAAELVLPNYVKKYPNDKRPQEAIKAAKNCLKEQTEAAGSAAWSAASAKKL